MGTVVLVAGFVLFGVLPTLLQWLEQREFARRTGYYSQEQWEAAMRERRYKS